MEFQKTCQLLCLKQDYSILDPPRRLRVQTRPCNLSLGLLQVLQVLRSGFSALLRRCATCWQMCSLCFILKCLLPDLDGCSSSCTSLLRSQFDRGPLNWSLMDACPPASRSVRPSAAVWTSLVLSLRVFYLFIYFYASIGGAASLIIFSLMRMKLRLKEGQRDG